MANITIPNTLAALTTITAAAHNTNYSTISTWLNNRDNASDYWLNMKVSATASNPAEVKSSAASCEFDIDCTGSNGTPILTWRRSGTTYFTAGVDGAASNLLKFGTTALTTNVAMQIPTTGVQVQFAIGNASTPSIAFIGASATGLFGTGSLVNVAIAGSSAATFTANGIQLPNGAVGTPTFSFLNDATTGFYSVTGGSVGYSGSGTLRATFAATAPYVTIGDNANTTDVCLRINGVSTTGAQTATMTNGPTAGNPTLWLQVNIKGTNRYIPCWA